jgi:hypothetical protein
MIQRGQGLLVWLCCLLALPASATTLQISHRAVPANQTAFLDILLKEPEDVAGVQGRLRYNPQLLQFVDPGQAGTESEGSVLSGANTLVNYEPGQAPDSEGWLGVSFVMAASVGTNQEGRLIRFSVRAPSALASTLGAVKWDPGLNEDGKTYKSVASNSQTRVAPALFEDGVSPFWRVDTRPWRFTSEPAPSLAGPVKILGLVPGTTNSYSPAWQVAADKTNRIQVQLEGNRNGTFTFDVVDAAGNAVTDAGQFEGAKAGEALVGTSNVAFFTPSDTIPGDASTARRRPLLMRVRYKPATGSEQAFTQPFTLVLPPVVLVHGTWDGPKTWDRYFAENDDRPTLYGVGYTAEQVLRPDLTASSDYKAAGDALTKQVGDFQKSVLQNYGLATARLDYVGYGAGGLAIRYAASAPTGGTALNTPRRIITIDTPHFGMELAPVLIYGVNAPSEDQEGVIAKNALYRTLAAFGYPVNTPAMEALSPAAIDLPALPVPSLSVIGVASNSTDWIVPELLRRDGWLIRQLNFDSFDAFIRAVFADDHDYASSRRHQVGGNSAYYALTDTTYPNAPDRAQTQVMARLLQSDPFSGFSKTGYPEAPPRTDDFFFPQLISSMMDQLASTLKDRKVPPGQEPTPFYTIKSPKSGATVNVGDTVTVTVEPTTSGTDGLFSLVGEFGGSIATADNAPWTMTFPVADTLIGNVKLTLAGYSASGNASIQTLTLNVQPKRPVIALDFDPSASLNLNVGDRGSISLWATAATGQRFNVTAPASGANLASDNPPVLTVGSQGELNALQNGTAHLTASLGGLTQTLNVKIGTGIGPPPPVGVKGDVNGDGKVNVQDATLALRMAVGLIKPTAVQLIAGDINGDGRIAVTDATAILRKAVGLG